MQVMGSSLPPSYTLLLFPCLPLLLLLLLLLLIILAQPCTSLAWTTPTTYDAGRKTKPVILPLRAQKAAPLPVAREAKKLLFHHNVSLTVSVAVGAPPQNVSMVLDTGSELSWLLCNTSSSPNSFDPLASSSYRPLPCSSPACQSQARDLPVPPSCDPSSNACRVSLSYADASSSEGSLAADSFLLGRPPPLRTVFGCIFSSYDSSASAASAAAAHGLLGMNRGALSFVTQSATRRFAYCISDRDDSGVLLLGGDAGSPPFAPRLNYTPLLEISLPLPYFDRVAYSVQLDGIRVGAALLPIPKSVLAPDHTGAGQTMVDSGTQFTFLLGDAYDALKLEFLRQTRALLTPLNEPDFVFQGAFDLCFTIPAAGAGPPLPSRLPEVAVVLRGAELRVTGDRLLYRVDGETRGGDGVWCATFGNSDLLPISAYVIGHHHQQNHWVEYDLDNRRVGLAPLRCDLAAHRLSL